MGSLSYISRKSTLLLLFNAARVRLMVNSEDISLLPDTRIASATEDINRIADDIREAIAADSLDHSDTTRPLGKPADREPALPTTVAVSAALKAGNTRRPDQPARIRGVSAVGLSVEVDGVQWAGEYNALAGRREKAGFVSRLVMLGYRPDDFRVTVQRVPSEGPEDARQRYSVLVAQVQNGLPYREKQYLGGHGAEWINEFSREAAIAFPRNIDPVLASDVKHP
jgi:hypothetical protein